MALTKITGEGVGDLDTLTVDGDVTLNDGSPNLRLKDTDTNRFVDLLYGTRVSTIRNTMASGEDMDTVEPSMVFSFKDDGETRTAMTIDHDGQVGIGTASPQQSLHLKSNNPGGKIRLEMGQSGVANGDVTGEIQFYHNDASGAGVNADIKGICTNSAGAGALTFGTGTTSTTERMRIDTSGNVFIGKTGEVGTQDGFQFKQEGECIVGRGANDTMFIFQDSNNNGTQVGSISMTGSSTAYNTSSDYRLKENVTATWDATTRLKQLNPVRFNFITDADTTVDGFLAHEAQAVVPEAVTGTHNEVDDDGNPVMQGIDQSKLVPLLVKTIQELEARITALEAE